MYVELKNINKTYGGYKASDNVSFGIEKGKLIGLLGPSGSGKTTILRMIAGLEQPDSGEIIIDGREVNDVPASERGIGFVFQNYALFRYMTVYDNIAFGLKVQKADKKYIRQRVMKLVELIGLKGLEKRYPSQLSGGQRQRVAMGRAIVRNPKVFLMDEPLSNLDAKLRGQMRVEISKLHQRLQATIIYVTHDQTEAMTLGTRIVVMKDGVIQQVDSPQNLYDKPCNKFVAGFIGAPQMNMIDADVKESGADVTLTFGGHTITLPAEKAKIVKEKGYVGKTVTIGIRPEDLHDDEAWLQASPKSVIEATIRVYELLGAEVNLYFDIDDAQFIARVNPRTTARVGSVVKIALDMSKVHVFDKETEKVIAN